MSISELRELLFFKDADTLAFIDPPSYKPAWSLHPSCAQSIGHRIHSWKLLESASPFLRAQFDQRTQERNIKRRGGLPDGIKYIIDLTPPSVEDEALLTISELSCPLGIRTWAYSQLRWYLPEDLVGGSETQGDIKDQSGCLAEYSPERHRAGIVQVLRVLEGLKTKLDTPCKLWTFFAVAKVYGLASMPEFSVRVEDWVYDGNNRRLIEIHPEITYRLGKGIQCAHMMRDSYCVLVGEEALRLLRDGSAPASQKRQTTVYGRPLGPLDDDDEQRVQYAGKSLLGYVIEQFVELAGTEMRWLHQSKMFQNVLAYNPSTPHALETKKNLISCLKDFVRTSIIAALSQKTKTRLFMNVFQRPNTYPMSDFLDVFGSLSLTERLMSKTFWTLLSDTRLGELSGGADVAVPWGTSLASLGGEFGAFRDQHNAIIRRITKQELYSKVTAFNRLSLNTNLGPRPERRQRKYPGIEYDELTYGPDGSFSIRLFLEQADYHRRAFIKRMFPPARDEMSYVIADTITSLTEQQHQFLPLWAGGCDDGTGGVYADPIPLAEVDGFSAPGPSIHTGSAAPSAAPSIASFLESTVHGASHKATEGIDSGVLSASSELPSETDDASIVGSSDFQAVDHELSFTVETSADDIDDDPFNSDTSEKTVVLDHGDLSELSEFEELNMQDGPAPNLPIKQKNA
ncbi:hypothetical protein BDW72DRAFT_183870 [Aspergillus terricola var. indicus]